MGNSRGRHRAQRSRQLSDATKRAARTVGVKGPALGVLGVAAAGAAVVGLTPTLSASPELLANVYYLRGTNIGSEPTDQQYRDFMDRVFDGTGQDGAISDTKVQVPYNAGFWPISHGGFSDLKWNDSVQQGVDHLGEEPVGDGDVIFGFSQGAVVASQYKGAHSDPDVTYVLVENPSRPNGGVMSRFEGLTIPILDITFSGPTPETDSPTVDVARQYDGWADFPTYPLNVLATANAVMGIIYVHGNTQTVDDLNTQLADIETDPTAPDYDPMYYQKHGNTEYYLIPTERLPLLMPLEGIVPDPILDAADAPLRNIIEKGYDRSDYSEPTKAKLFPSLKPAQPSIAATEVVNTTVATDAPATTVIKKKATANLPDPAKAVATALKDLPKPSTLDKAVPKKSTFKAPSIKNDFKLPSFKKAVGAQNDGGVKARASNKSSAGGKSADTDTSAKDSD